MRRLDDGISEDVSCILDQRPVPPQLDDAVVRFAAELARDRLLTAYTQLIGRANRSGGSAVACGRLADGVVRRIGRFADGVTSRVECFRWLAAAPHDQLRRAEMEVELLTQALRDTMRARPAV